MGRIPADQAKVEADSWASLLSSTRFASFIDALAPMMGDGRLSALGEGMVYWAAQGGAVAAVACPLPALGESKGRLGEWGDARADARRIRAQAERSLLHGYAGATGVQRDADGRGGSRRL